MAETLKLNVRVPKFRIWIMQLAIPVLAIFVRAPEKQERVCQAMVDWAVRGVRFSGNGKSV
jgi:hypothetical protein